MIRSGAGARRRRRLSIGLPPNNGEYRAGGMTDDGFRDGPEEHCAERFARLATDHDKVSSSAVGLRDDLLGAVPLADDLVRNSRLVTLRPMVCYRPSRISLTNGSPCWRSPLLRRQGKTAATRLVRLRC
jgi:hypothetical protein